MYQKKYSVEKQPFLAVLVNPEIGVWRWFFHQFFPDYPMSPLPTPLNSTEVNLCQLNFNQLNSTVPNSAQLKSTQLNSTKLNSSQVN